MPSLGGLTPNLGQAGGKLQAALKEAALPSMPSMPKHMPSFDPTQWAGLSSATSGDAGDEALAKTRTEAEHFAALLEAGEYEKAARFAANSPKQEPTLTPTHGPTHSPSPNLNLPLAGAAHAGDDPLLPGRPATL